MKLMVDEKGFIVFFFHDAGESKRVTCCSIFHEGSRVTGLAIVTGVAVCSPQDQFSYARGRKIAFAHALLGLPRERRKPFWNAMWEARKKVTTKEWTV